MATTQQKLDEALDARHKLLTGNKAVSLAHGDRRIQYSELTAEHLNALERYIAELQREIAGTKPVRNRIRYVVPD